MEVMILINGEVSDLDFLKETLQQGDYLICADGAAKYLRAIDVVPDLMVGDFDSIAPEDFAWMKAKGVTLREFPARKDFTDSELALRYALELKPKKITLLGAVGSRWDHSLSNIMFLDHLHRLGVEGEIRNEKGFLTLVSSRTTLRGTPGDIVSLIPLSEQVTGVTLRGLEYPLTDHTIQRGSSLGISNQLIDAEGEITLKTGKLLVFIGRE